MGRADDARRFFDDLREASPLKGSPLGRLLECCFEALRLRSQRCFQELAPAFARPLARDPELPRLLRRVGSAHLGLPDDTGFSLMSMLGNLLG